MIKDLLLGFNVIASTSCGSVAREALERVFKSTLDLLVAYKEQIAEAAKEEEAEDFDDMDGLQSDDEDDDADGSDKEMGVDAKDGDEANNTKLQKLAAQDGIRGEVQTMSLINHPNLLRVHWCSG